MKNSINFKFLTALFTLLFFGQALKAAPVDASQAALVGKHFFQSTKKGRALADNVTLQMVSDINPPFTSPLYYVFNVNNNDGFVIVAADDAVQPILGYSNDGAFALHEGLEKWLVGYQAQIFYAVEKKLSATTDIKARWSGLKAGVPDSPDGGGVDPLLQSKWNQSPYENLFCPGLSVTGCVATAMAQIMYYWKHPAQGVGTHSYVEQGSASYPSYGTLSADFGATTYQWGNMPWQPNSVNLDISLLMLHCGISVDMDYSPAGSGTSTRNVAKALKKYFKYDSTTVTYVVRADYSDAAWISLLKQELDAARPVQYKGVGSNGGHSFVCDGYDDNGFFHFNWGWGGSSDGFFVVDALNPGSLGVGGGSGGFNSDQGAVIGIQPDPTIPTQLIMTTDLITIGATLNGTPVPVTGTSFANAGSQPFAGQVTLGLYDAESGALVRTSTTVLDYYTIGGAGAVINDVFNMPLVPPGTYTLSLLYRLDGATDWAKLPDGQFHNAFNVLIFTASQISTYDKPIIQPASVQQNKPFTINATFDNTSLSSPFFQGDIGVSLHGLNGAWYQDIATVPNQPIIYGAPVDLTFNSTGLNVNPGTYQIVFWAKDPNNGWLEVNVPTGYDATAYITILPPPPTPDAYEPNGSTQTATVFPLNFAGNIALISTFGSTHHVEEDEDFYKVVFPSDPKYVYDVKGILYDSYHHTNGGNYTNDCFWRFYNGNTWSLPYDDVLLVPGGSFQMAAGTEAYFYVKPYFAGTTGSYLLELEITRLPAFDTPCGAVNLPVNGVEQTGFSNTQATVSPAYEPGIPVTGECMGTTTWCNTEAEPRLLHSVWFSFQAPPSGGVEISTCGLSDFDTQIALYTATDCNNLSSYALLGANDDGLNCSGYTSLLQYNGLVAGQTYYILVDGYEDATGNIGIKLTPLQGSSVQNIAATPDVLQVSPNPSAGSLNILFKGQQAIESLRLTDMSGKLLMTIPAKANVREMDLNLDETPCGVYFLQVQAGNQVYTQKVIIQR